MTCSVNVSQLSLPVAPVIAQEFINQWPWSQDGGYVGISIMKFHYYGLLGYSHCWLPNLLIAEITLNPQYDTITWVNQPITWWQVDYIGQLSSWKGELCLYWIWTCLFCLSVCNAYAKTTICEPTNYFIQKCGILHSITFDQGTYFITNEVRQRAHSHRIHWSYLSCYLQFWSNMTEWCNQLVKAQHNPPYYANCSKSILIMLLFFSCGRIHKSRNWEGWNGSCWSYYYS